MSDERSDHSQLTALLTAMKMLQSPTVVTPSAPQDERGLTKVVVGVISALVIACCVWVGSTVSGQTATLASISTSVVSIQKSLGDIQSTQGETTQQIGDLKAIVSRDDQRIGTNEQALQRLNDRVRLLEGQPPLPPRTPNG